MRSRPNAGWPGRIPIGVIEARLSRDELENKRVRFDKLRAIMPSGLEVNYPGCGRTSFARHRAGLFQGRRQLHRLPRRSALAEQPRQHRARSSRTPIPAPNCFIASAKLECYDENTGENPKPVQIRKINSRLMFEHEDMADMEVLPLLAHRARHR